MQRLEVSGAVRPIYGSLGVKWLRKKHILEIFLLKFGVDFPKLFGIEVSVESGIFIMFFVTVIYDVFL